MFDTFTYLWDYASLGNSHKKSQICSVTRTEGVFRELGKEAFPDVSGSPVAVWTDLSRPSQFQLTPGRIQTSFRNGTGCWPPPVSLGSPREGSGFSLYLSTSHQFFSPQLYTFHFSRWRMKKKISTMASKQRST